MKKNLLYLLIAFVFGQVNAQKTSIWKVISSVETSNVSRKTAHKNTEGEKYYALNALQLKQTLTNASSIHSKNAGTLVSIPNLNGELEQFEVWENSNFDPILQAQYPDIRAYSGKGTTDKSASISFSLAPIGFQTVVFRTGKDTEFIESYDKAATVYVVFSSKNSHSETTTFSCGVKDKNLNFTPIQNTNRSSAGQLKTMRLAMSCNGEYAQYFGGTVAGALAGMNASLTSINALFERDLAIHVNLIANNASLIYLNAATDPYSNAATGSANDVWNLELQNMLSSTIGNAAYDVGHLVCNTGGNGNAGCIGCVCNDDDITDQTDINKGAGFTSAQTMPEGSVFNFDFLAHEFGHQFGATHTFSYEYEGSGTNIEPGSGCATMGYAGVTNWDVQPHNIIQFSTASVLQVEANMATKTCPVSTPSSATPVVNAGADYTIPKGTAFKLTGTGSDADANDVLSYSWEQNDDGTAATVGANSTTTDMKTVGPTFRLFLATPEPIRYLPKLENVLYGELTTPTNWESVSNVARDLNFRLTVRDNHLGAGQTKTDAMVVTVDAAVGPFVVTSQNTTGITWAQGSTQTVTWNVNGTSSLAGSTNVDVLLSTDGGLTFTTLAASVANNGTTSVTAPSVSSTTCRLMVKPTGNIYYAVNSEEFEITTVASNAGFAFDDFALYPNPSEGNFTIKLNSTSTNKIDIKVNDIRGRQVFSNSYTNDGFFNENIQLKSIQNGVYLININDGINNMTRKIIIK
ncbi:reprolysin-like metallopeptidase [uncultured Flavobacterium sp.]|uniref:zinc-dependent metalloprotease n=1 Tax=uncultured Flavobacterium sp. TaxID=165435 RepID=UPI0030ECB452|tara:strand:+ start:94170 stop:96410 length:2241 start_codon:yes stop_codon:yes gene_type:complete